MQNDKRLRLIAHKVRVYLTCSQKWMPAPDNLRVVNVEEDIQGRDLVTFECPECMELHTSLCTR